MASLSVFCYFLAALFGRQYLVPREEDQSSETFPHLNVSYSDTAPFNRHTPDFYFPFFTFIELLSYMGWIKVAETLLNPFGDDDEDFQVNYMIDRNLQVCFQFSKERSPHNSIFLPTGFLPHRGRGGGGPGDGRGPVHGGRHRHP